MLNRVTPVPLRLDRATAVNNAMFVGDVAVRAPDVAAEMLDRAEGAIDELGKRVTLR